MYFILPAAAGRRGCGGSSSRISRTMCIADTIVNLHANSTFQNSTTTLKVVVNFSFLLFTHLIRASDFPISYSVISRTYPKKHNGLLYIHWISLGYHVSVASHHIKDGLWISKEYRVLPGMRIDRGFLDQFLDRHLLWTIAQLVELSYFNFVLFISLHAGVKYFALARCQPVNQGRNRFPRLIQEAKGDELG